MGGGCLLESRDARKDLLTMADKQLSVRSPGGAGASRADAVLGCIHGVSDGIPPLRTTLMRPILGYCNQLWGSCFQTDVEGLWGGRAEPQKFFEGGRKCPAVRDFRNSVKEKRQRGKSSPVSKHLHGENLSETKTALQSHGERQNTCQWLKVKPRQIPAGNQATIFHSAGN